MPIQQSEAARSDLAKVTTVPLDAGLTPEQRARVLIDAQLTAAGWCVCDSAALDLIHHRHAAVREVRMKRGHGQVDYLLYVDRRIVAVSYTHLRAHETRHDLVCRLLLD